MANPSFTREAPLSKRAWAFEAQLPLNEPVLTSFKGTTPWGPTLWAWKSSQGGNGTPQGPRAASFPSSGFLASSGAPPLEAWPQGPALRLKPPPAMSSQGGHAGSPVWKDNCTPDPRATLPPAPSPPSCWGGKGRPLTLDPHICHFPAVVPQNLQALPAPLLPQVPLHRRELLRRDHETASEA